MATTVFQPPPTWALPVLLDEVSGKATFNPIWLRWFLDLSQNLGSSGAGSGSVSSVGGTGTVNGITLTGTVTTAGNLTLGGTLSNVSLTTQVTGILPIANGGTGTSTAGVSATITTAKLTALGANGSMTFTNGLLTAQTPAT
tara:strand:- start:1254 stop:1679 length:426 start_codon:yes stop_codon:yes gene_type:complete